MLIMYNFHKDHYYFLLNKCSKVRILRSNINLGNHLFKKEKNKTKRNCELCCLICLKFVGSTFGSTGSGLFGSSTTGGTTGFGTGSTTGGTTTFGFGTPQQQRQQTTGGNTTAFGTSGFGTPQSTAFGTPTAGSQPFQLQKPPMGNKRGKKT